MTSTSPLPIDAVLFDYGLVLSGPPDPAAWASMRSITGFDEATLDRGYWAPRHDYDAGTLTGEQFWQAVASAGNLTLTPAQVSALIEADIALWGQLNQPMVAWTERLQRAGIRTGILSNMGDAMTHGLLARHSWLDTFHHHVWSHTLKLAKPDPAIFPHSVQGLGVPAERILFIDDRANNIEAARAAGLQAIQYLDHEEFLRELNVHGWGHLWEPTPAT
jgi:putative hydrolase of the HAD superfamily